LPVEVGVFKGVFDVPVKLLLGNMGIGEFLGRGEVRLGVKFGKK
jgi:hypothetical protein